MENGNNLKYLLDPKLPLLEKFREKSPGTFQHCKNVAGFCESVALEIGLDIDLLNIAGMYHDVGKMNYPEAFSENQDGKNIHDNIEPSISFQLITRHVGDSVLILLQIPEMPREILDIVAQHHGNTVLRYFYNKSNSDLDDIYRYKCPQPKTIEAAVLMICDSVEATAKSLSNSGELSEQTDRKSVVDSTIRRLVDDNQLDEMKVGHLKSIRKVLYKELEGIYHKREVYGDEKTIKEAKESSILEK